TPEAVENLAALLAAGKGRVRSVHFGAYDFLSALDVAAGAQHLLHPLCEFARARMKLVLASSDVRLSDGATSFLPLGDAAAGGLELHAAHVRHALEYGIYQGWDLHPGQLGARYVALYRFFLGNAQAMRQRLERFVDDAARARASGGVFDDAATARGV